MSSLIDQFEFPVRRSRYVCREMTEEDVNTALGWLSAHLKKQGFPRDFLPETGVCVSVDGKLACLIPVYFEHSSKVAVLGHCLVNGETNKKQACFAIKKCMEYAVEYASARGKKYIVSIFGRNSINKIADNCGFITADTIEEKFFFCGR